MQSFVCNFTAEKVLNIHIYTFLIRTMYLKSSIRGTKSYTISISMYGALASMTACVRSVLLVYLPRCIPQFQLNAIKIWVFSPLFYLKADENVIGSQTKPENFREMWNASN